MTTNETKFRNKIIQTFGKKDLFITKFPDYKQGSKGISGVPDYLVIYKGKTLWFEVKNAESNTTFNMNKIRETQYITINELSKAGAQIYIAIYMNDGELYIIDWGVITVFGLLVTDKITRSDLNILRTKLENIL